VNAVNGGVNVFVLRVSVSLSVSLFVPGLENGFQKPKFLEVFKNLKNLKSPKFRFFKYFYFWVKFYTN